MLCCSLPTLLYENGNFSQILASNHLNLFLICLPLSLYPGQKTGTSDPYTGKKTGTLNPLMVLRPELLLLTLVIGPELTALLQTRVGTFDSGPVLKGTKSCDPYLKKDSQFRSCDQDQGQ